MAVRRMNDLLIRACRGEAVPYTPVWIMRQAGRYLPAYRALREGRTMLEALRDPDLSAEITLLPLQTFDLDAAIVFSDILPPLMGMGMALEFVPGVGPRLSAPLRTTKQIDRLRVPPAAEAMPEVLATIARVKPALSVPLIGFAGAPFTLASYAIEGGSTRHFRRTKALMYTEPAAWDRLLTKLVAVVADLLAAQVKAGADCVQVFDSWAGALGPDDYARYVQPYSRVLFARLAALKVPVIHFSTGTGTYLHMLAEVGGDVLGVDWRVGLDQARRAAQRSVMGNLDPLTLFGPWRELKAHIDAVLARAGTRGHIFNLGHGILPETPVDNVRRLVDYVHSATARST